MGYEYLKQWRASKPNIKEIRAEEARKWRAAHPETAKAIKQRYRSKQRDEILPREAKQAAARRRSDPEGSLRRRKAFEDRKKEEQVAIAGRPKPSVCEICGELNLRIVFDHCHSHGHFRGWICDRCNKVLGMVKDSGTLLHMLRRYLVDGEAKFRSPQSLTEE